MSDQPAKTSLLELLRGVPQDARAVYEHHSTSHQFIPYGRLCHEAADILDAMRWRDCESDPSSADLRIIADRMDSGLPWVIPSGWLRRYADILDAMCWRDCESDPPPVGAFVCVRQWGDVMPVTVRVQPNARWVAGWQWHPLPGTPLCPIKADA